MSLYYIQQAAPDQGFDHSEVASADGPLHSASSASSCVIGMRLRPSTAIHSAPQSSAFSKLLCIHLHHLHSASTPSDGGEKRKCRDLRVGARLGDAGDAALCAGRVSSPRFSHCNFNRGNTEQYTCEARLGSICCKRLEQHDRVMY